MDIRENIFVPGGSGVRLEGLLSVPADARGLVLFAHGSGSSRLSPRNRRTAEYLETHNLGTLLFDLLTPEEANDPANVFDVPLLAERLTAAARWLHGHEDFRHLPYGFFGASTGGGAALWAAADLPDVAAVVSRGGRPDLAAPRLHLVRAPTLLLVGGEDKIVLALNRQALRALSNGRLVVVPGATHLFEEEGAMEQVERESAHWFLSQFGAHAEEVA